MVWQSRSFHSKECGPLVLDKKRLFTKEKHMEPETTCTSNDTTEKGKLYMAMELSQKEWKLGFSVGPGQAPRLRSVPGRDLGGLMTEIQLARERFGLGEGAGELRRRRTLANYVFERIKRLIIFLLSIRT